MRQGEPVDREELKKETDLSERKLVKALHRLEETGAVEELPSGEVVASEDGPPIEEAVKQAAEAQQEHKDYEQLRLEKMRLYAELRSCRREYLLQYFGEEAPAGCGNCDVCEAGERAEQSAKAAAVPAPSSPVAAAAPAAFPLKTRVVTKSGAKALSKATMPTRST